jgi:hypothetical protein
MPATMEDMQHVEQMVRTLCDASGLSESVCANAEIKTTDSHINVNLVSGTYAWVLRWRYAKKGERLPNPILTHIWLAEDTGTLTPVELVDGKELPWGYT